MSKKYFFLIFLTFLLGIGIVNAVDITNCSTLDTANSIYYLQNDILNSTNTTCMNIKANNITLDCQGYLIDGIQTAAKTGIFINNKTNIVITQCIISGWYGDGIYIVEGYNNTIKNNILINNVVGIDLWEDTEYIWTNHTIINNTLSNSVVTTGLYSIIVHGQKGTSIINNTISQNLTVLSTIGIGLDIYSDNSRVSGNIISGSRNGIYTDISSNNTIENNLVFNCVYGIVDNEQGFYYLASNIIRNNIVQNSSLYGLYLGDGDIVYNNLLNNSINDKNQSTNWSISYNTSLQSGTRIYSSGTQIGGNYWTNSTGTGYSDTCTDIDIDGFCDLPLNITTMTSCVAGSTCGNNVDYFPLSNEYGKYCIQITTSGELRTNTTFLNGSSYLVSYTYGSDSAAATAIFASRNAVGEIATNWMSLIVSIMALAIIIGLVLGAFAIGKNRR